MTTDFRFAQTEHDCLAALVSYQATAIPPVRYTSDYAPLRFSDYFGFWHKCEAPTVLRDVRFSEVTHTILLAVGFFSVARDTSYVGCYAGPVSQLSRSLARRQIKLI